MKYGQLGGELLVKQKASRKKVTEGDVFTLKLSDSRFVFGLVVSTKAKIRLEDKDYLFLYLYKDNIGRDRSNVPDLTEKNLLIPPFFSLSLAWTQGYAETVSHVDLDSSIVFPVNYVHDFFADKYYNEEGEEVVAPPESSKNPVTDCGVGNLSTLDLDIREALGIAIPEWGKSYFD